MILPRCEGRRKAYQLGIPRALAVLSFGLCRRWRQANYEKYVIFIIY
jgi:hypothetical protein